jgi:hypothetical protein
LRENAQSGQNKKKEKKAFFHKGVLSLVEAKVQLSFKTISVSGLLRQEDFDVFAENLVLSNNALVKTTLSFCSILQSLKQANGMIFTPSGRV